MSGASFNGSDRHEAAHELTRPSEQERALVDVVWRKALEGDWSAAAWLLERWFPGRWSLKAEDLLGVMIGEPRLAAEPVPDQSNSPRVWKPGPKPKPLSEELEADIAQRIKDPGAPELTQEKIAQRHGLTRDQVKHLERRIRRRREQSG
jgi:hypothetical protein